MNAKGVYAVRILLINLVELVCNCHYQRQSGRGEYWRNAERVHGGR